MEGFIGEIRTWANSYAPRGWMYCEGQELAIGQYQAMYVVIGTAFGGNGTTTFRLPDLRGRAAVGMGAGPGLTPRTLGQTAGAESVTLTEAQLPAHRHSLNASSEPASVASPVGAYPAAAEQLMPYASSAGGVMASAMIATAGQSQAHSNLQPYLAVRYIICVEGYFPVRS
jgi:microcystin-dependent protein